MKINKVIWSSTEKYADFWNINSQIHNTFLDMDCLLLLYGKKENCNLSEEYGNIIEIDYIEGYPTTVQFVLNKFHYTRNEPDTTWIIGDMDQIPLQRTHFIDNLINVPDDHYVHLAENHIQELYGNDIQLWRTEGSVPGKCYLTAPYHVAKGSTFTKALNLDLSLETHIEALLNQWREYRKKIGASYAELHDQRDWTEKEIRQHGLWSWEEIYITSLLHQNYIDKFTGFERAIRGPKRRIIDWSLDRCAFNPNQKDLYVDIHCPVPYTQHKTVIDNILNFFWGTEIR
jgi:hypothetical protein